MQGSCPAPALALECLLTIDARHFRCLSIATEAAATLARPGPRAHRWKVGFDQRRLRTHQPVRRLSKQPVLYPHHRELSRPVHHVTPRIVELAKAAHHGDHRADLDATLERQPS